MHEDQRCTPSRGCARPGWPLSGAPRIPNDNLDSLDLVKKLLAHGADPNVRVAWKEMKRGGFDLGMVVNNPPNINVGRNYITLVGATPFYLAAKHSDVELMRVLAAHGANPTIPTVQGVTPFMAAAGLGFWQGESPGPNNGVPERRHARSGQARLGAGRQAGRQRHRALQRRPRRRRRHRAAAPAAAECARLRRERARRHALGRQLRGAWRGSARRELGRAVPRRQRRRPEREEPASGGRH